MQALAQALHIDVRHAPGHTEVVILDHTLHTCAPAAVQPRASQRLELPAPASMRLAVHVPAVLVSVVHAGAGCELLLCRVHNVAAAAALDDEGAADVRLTVQEIRAGSSDPAATFVDTFAAPVVRVRSDQGWALDPTAAAVEVSAALRVTAAVIAVDALDISAARAALQLDGDAIHRGLAFLAAISPHLSSLQPAATPEPAGATAAALARLAAPPAAGAAAAARPPRCAVTAANVSVSPLRLIFSFAAPTQRTARLRNPLADVSQAPALLLSVAGVSCASFTVQAFDSGAHSESVASVARRYTSLIKDAVLVVRPPPHLFCSKAFWFAKTNRHSSERPSPLLHSHSLLELSLIHI